MARLARAALERPPARAFGLVAANDNPTLNRTTSFTPDAWGDALNRRTSKTFAAPWTANNVVYGYDLAGRPLSALYSNQSGAPGVAWTYDAAGRRTGEATNGQALAFTYDADSNPATLTWPDTAQVTFAYDPADRFSSVGGSAFSVAAGYDTLSRVNALTRPASSSAIGYDKADRMASLAHGFSPTAGNETWTQVYTSGGQLAQSTSSNSAWDWQAASQAAIATSVNGLNQNAAVGAASWTYDANGNLTYDGVRTFAYDPENRLLTESGPISMTLAYDPTGRLEQSVINGTTTGFLYDGDALVAEYNGSGAVLRRYIHGPEVDNPLVWFEGSAVTSGNANYLIADRQGSIAGVASTAGALAANYNYDAYGAPNAWGAIGTAPRFRYTGQIAIPEAQLYYYKARLYDPASGKFLQTDPVGDQSDLNLYAYVRGDPVDEADPSGNCPISTCGVGGGALDLEFSLGPSLAQSSPDSGFSGTSSSPGVPAWAGVVVKAPTIQLAMNDLPPGPGAIARAILPAPKTPGVLPAHEAAMYPLLGAAIEANRSVSRLVPQPLRGIAVHAAFAAEIRELGAAYRSEQSYLNGLPVPYGTPRSSRADAIVGSLLRPLFAVDLKTGGAYVTRLQYENYKRNLPMGVPLYVINAP